MSDQSLSPPISSRLRTVASEVRWEGLAALVVLSIVLSLATPYFLTVQNIFNIAVASAVIAVLAVGMTFVISGGGIDLSVGSTMALCGVAGALAVSWGLPGLIAFPLMLLVGIAVGAFNGVLIAALSIPAFIVTLATLSIARGMALLLADGRAIYGLDTAFRTLGQDRILGVPVPILFMLAVVAIGHLVLRHTAFGLRTLSMGDNPMAIRVTGCNLRRQTVMVYVIAGGCAALAAILFNGRINAGDPTAGVMYELQAISAVVIGGTALTGGRGTVIGSLVGALIIGVLQNGLNLLAVPSFYQYVAIGSILILAVSGEALWKRN